MICVDAAVAVKWVRNEEHTERARNLYRITVSAGETVVAPSLTPIEVTNIIRQRMRVQDGLTLAEAEIVLNDFLDFRFTLRDFPGMHQRALAIADAHDLPAAYDAHYLALAEMLRRELWTDDRRLPRTLAGEHPLVRWIGDCAEMP